jgi:transposase
MKILGIDISKATLVCCLLDQQGNMLDSFEAPNSKAGIRKLHKRAPAQALLCFEPTGMYSKLLIATLSGRRELHQLNSDQVKAGSTSMNRTKTDERDSRVIAQAGMRLALLEPKALQDARVTWSDEHEDRQALVTEYERVKDEIVRRENQLEALSVNPAQAARRSEQRIRAEIQRFKQEAKQIKHDIEQHIADDESAQLLLSIPGIGVLNAAALSARIGDIERFHSADSLKCFIGLFPRQKKSGRFEAPARMAKNGSKLLRHLLWNAARVAARHNPVCKALFERLVARGKHAAAAYGAVARKLVQIIYGVLKTKTTFKTQVAA